VDRTAGVTAVPLGLNSSQAQRATSSGAETMPVSAQAACFLLSKWSIHQTASTMSPNPSDMA
jgi:hypothetical protein